MHKAGRDPRFVCEGNAKHPAGGNIDVPRIAANCCPTIMHIVRECRDFFKIAIVHGACVSFGGFFFLSNWENCIIVVFKDVFKDMLGSVKFYKKCLDETFQNK